LASRLIFTVIGRGKGKSPFGMRSGVHGSLHVTSVIQ
jgi:hypothetical protein